MSHNVFDEQFTAGSESSGVITVNECGPVDLVRSLVRRTLAADATVMAAAGDRVEAYDIPPVETQTTGRAIYVFAQPFEQEDAPSDAERVLIEAVVVVRWPQSYTTGPVDDFAPTVWTLITKCEDVLADNAGLTFTYNTASGDRQLQTAEQSQPGNSTAVLDVEQTGGAVVTEIRFSRIYEVKLQRQSGRVARLVEAGVL